MSSRRTRTPAAHAARSWVILAKTELIRDTTLLRTQHSITRAELRRTSQSCTYDQQLTSCGSISSRGANSGSPSEQTRTTTGGVVNHLTSPVYGDKRCPGPNKQITYLPLVDALISLSLVRVQIRRHHRSWMIGTMDSYGTSA
jgi:hypothetical protein